VILLFDFIEHLMRLCVIANGFQEDYMLHYLASISGKVQQIDFIGSNIYPKERIDPSINFYDLRGGGIEGLTFTERVKRVSYYYFNLFLFFIKRPHRGIVHTQWLRFKILDGIIFPIICRALGYKTIYTVHDIVPHDKDTVYNRLIFRIIYSLNWKLIVHTEYLKKRLCEEFRIFPKKIKVIRHGVYEVKDKDILPREEAKSRLGIAKDVVVIIFFGYITYYKGLDILLEAFTRIRSEKKLRLIVAGRPYENYRQALNELQIIYNRENIQFLIRKIEENELPVLFGAADITVIPYREASQSGVLFMSYAFGIPVIAPDIGGFPYDVIDNKTGFIFKTCNINNLLAKLEEFVNKRSDCMLKREEIRDFARTNYSWSKSGDDLIEFIGMK
jgi:glycosyltransferase involved in cell wall biosynthesis